VATVDSAETVTAHAPGTAVIIASTEGVEGHTDVRVVAWTERALVAIGDSAPPATLYTRTFTDNTDATHTSRLEARDGSFRMTLLGMNSGRYQLRFFVWVYRDGQSVQFGEHSYGGEWHYNLISGTYSLNSWNGQTLTARVLADGRLLVTGRLERGTPELNLTYAAN
jgi:hypothetical protein